MTASSTRMENVASRSFSYLNSKPGMLLWVSVLIVGAYAMGGFATGVTPSIFVDNSIELLQRSGRVALYGLPLVLMAFGGLVSAKSHYKDASGKGTTARASLYGFILIVGWFVALMPLVAIVAWDKIAARFNMDLPAQQILRVEGFSVADAIFGYVIIGVVAFLALYGLALKGGDVKVKYGKVDPVDLKSQQDATIRVLLFFGHDIPAFGLKVLLWLNDICLVFERWLAAKYQMRQTRKMQEAGIQALTEEMNQRTAASRPMPSASPVSQPSVDRTRVPHAYMGRPEADLEDTGEIPTVQRPISTEEIMRDASKHVVVIPHSVA